MHQALLISEVVDLILEPLSKRDLSACNRVCQAWHHPSTRLLWGAISILDPLWNLLGTITKDEYSRTWDIVAEPTVEMWERFYVYSSLVQHVAITGWCHDYNQLIRFHPSDKVAAMFTTAYQLGGAMFPSLRSWKFLGKNQPPFCPSRSNDRILLSIFLTARLDLLDINIGPINEPEAILAQDRSRLFHNPLPYLSKVAFLKQLALSLPNLTTLRLFDSVEHYRTSPVKELYSLPLLLSSWPKIHTLRFSFHFYLSDELLAALTRMPNLKRLDIKTPCIIRSASSSDLPPIENPFPQLEQLEIQEAQNIVMFLPYLSRCTTLQSLHISSAKTTAPFLQQVKFLQSRLRKISLGRLSGSFKTSDFRSLILFRNLVTFEFTTYYALEIDDKGFAEVIRQLPLLEELHMGCYDTGNDDVIETRLTLVALNHLVVECAHLKSVDLILSILSVPTLLTSPHPAQRRGSIMIGFPASTIHPQLDIRPWLLECCKEYDVVQVCMPGFGPSVRLKGPLGRT